MSYDIDYRYRGLIYDDIGSPTYNVGRIFAASLEAAGWPGVKGKNHIYPMHGKTGHELLKVLPRAVAWVRDEDNDEAVSGMEPENGWGDRTTVIRTYRDIIRSARSHPDGVLNTEYGSGLPDWALESDEDSP